MALWEDGPSSASTVEPTTTTGPSIYPELAGGNPLDRFASYTYNISLAAISPEEFNRLVNAPSIDFVPENVLITSAARKDSSLQRNQYFEREFYIQSLKFDTVVGLNATTRASNVISLKLEIVEPMGLSFFDRLLQVANQFNYKNFIDIPYLIIIDFVGYDDNGKIITRELAQHRKFIPIRMINSSMKVNTGGTSYVIDAIPYNHVAYLASETGASVPLNLQIKCNTVQDFFVGNQSSVEANQQLLLTLRSRSNALRDYADQLRQGEAGLLTTERVTDYRIYREFENRVRLLPVKAGSFAAGLNSYEQYLKNQNLIQQITKYNFVIDNDIGTKALVNQPRSISTNQAPMADPGARTLLANLPTADTGTDELYAVSAGTNIIEVINSVIKNSKYCHEQLNSVRQRQNGPIDWFKIVPQVTISDYDYSRGTYSKEITYTINKYQFYNTKSNTVIQQLPTKFLTEYNYIFTGQNKEIIDLRIEYDALFAILATSGPQKAQPKLSDNIPVNPNEGTTDYVGKILENNITPPKRFIKSNFVNQRGAATEERSETILTADLFNNILNISPDMMGINLKIVGDPRYIKQDDVFYNSNNSNIGLGTVLSSNNSILFDFEERYLKLNFKSPLDYNSETGLLDKSNDGYLQSKFSGLYRILRIENSFTKGKFEQTLDIVRLFLQDENGRALAESKPPGSSPSRENL